MQIFCDGGSAKSNALYGKNRALISWGIKIIGKDLDVELMGSRVVDQDMSACHEIIAFAEAVIWCHSHNGNTLNTRFFTDDKNMSLLSRPVLRERLFQLTKHMKTALSKIAPMYSKPTIALVEQYLIFAEINWVKGHANCTYNNRADYLATVAREIAAGTSRSPMSFDDWLMAGQSQWHPAGKHVKYGPFCEPGALERLERLQRGGVQPTTG